MNGSSLRRMQSATITTQAPPHPSIDRARVDLPGSIVQRLRTNYFSHAAHAATRYGISVDRLVRHIEEGFARRDDSAPVTPLRHVADLVHAAACVDQSGLAWADLIVRHEGAIARACLPMADEGELALLVRKFFGDLRQATARGSSQPTLRDYLGRPALRHWLAALARERLNELVAPASLPYRFSAIAR